MGRPGRADRTVVMRRIVDAEPAEVFEVLARPERHRELDGSGTLRGQARGPERLSAGAGFSMAMQQSRAAYRSYNKVLEFVEGSVLEWETAGRFRGRRFIGGQRWRYELFRIDRPDGGPATLVVHSYDWGAARAAPLLLALGYPRRAGPSMAGTLGRLAAAVGRD